MYTKKVMEKYSRWIESMRNYGISLDDSLSLRRIEMTLSRWSEQECGDSNNYCSWSIERDEQTNIPYKCIYPHTGSMRKYRIADRENGALKRLHKIMSNYPELTYYHQTDPRGCSLYIIRKSDLKDQTIDQVYYRGLCANY